MHGSKLCKRGLFDVQNVCFFPACLQPLTHNVCIYVLVPVAYISVTHFQMKQLGYNIGIKHSDE